MSTSLANSNEAMRKEILEKSDGRYLIYYRFQKSADASEKTPGRNPKISSPCKPKKVTALSHSSAVVSK